MTASAHPDATDEHSVRIGIDADLGALCGDVGVPDEAVAPAARTRGLVIFAHGGGSSRQSYRNRFLAGWMRMDGWATLRVDLLLPEEQERDLTSGVHRFDVTLIGQRLTRAIDWAVRENVPGSANIVLFGASTGAAAAVLAAAARPDVVSGVIARGGRVDLAAEALNILRAPILLIVGGADPETLRGNRSAIRQLRGDVTLKIIRRAGHTFEEPGAIGAVGARAMTWLNGRHRPAALSESVIEKLRRVCAAWFATAPSSDPDPSAAARST